MQVRWNREFLHSNARDIFRNLENLCAVGRTALVGEGLPGPTAQVAEAVLNLSDYNN